MDEEEINLWYEDKKEELVKAYFKRMDSLLWPEEKEGEPKPQKKTTEESKQLMLEYEKSFIESTAEIKKKYEVMISKLREQERKKVLKAEKKAEGSALTKFLQKAKAFFDTAKKAIANDLKESKKYLFEITSHVKRATQRISFFLKDKFHPSKIFFYQHIWPFLHYVNGPNRILKAKIIKFFDKVKEIIKKFLTSFKEKFSKLIKGTVSKLKLLIELIVKLIKKIIEIVKSIIDYLMKIVKVIQSKLPHKEEEEKKK